MFLNVFERMKSPVGMPHFDVDGSDLDRTPVAGARIDGDSENVDVVGDGDRARACLVFRIRRRSSSDENGSLCASPVVSATLEASSWSIFDEKVQKRERDVGI